MKVRWTEEGDTREHTTEFKHALELKYADDKFYYSDVTRIFEENKDALIARGADWDRAQCADIAVNLFMRTVYGEDTTAWTSHNRPSYGDTTRELEILITGLGLVVVTNDDNVYMESVDRLEAWDNE